MNKHPKPAVESLLQQMSLTEPPESLDQKISRIADEHTQRVAPHVAGRFGWTALISTAVAATLFGVVAGIAGVLASNGVEGPSSISGPTSTTAENTNSIGSERLREVDSAYTKCSTCHLFNVADRRICDHWRVEDIHEGFHSEFWQNCSICHLINENAG